MDERLWAVLRCPRCRGAVAERAAGGAACQACGRGYAAAGGFLDMVQAEGEADPAAPTPAMKLMTSRTFVRLYERRMRPFFARVFAGPGVAIPEPAEEFALYRGWHDLGPGGHWLDLSCGTGYFARCMAEAAPAALVVGLDISREMLVQAVEEPAPPGAVDWLRGDVYRLPFADGTFDGIVNGGSLHLYPDPAGAYREIARVLKPGGTYSASTFADSDRPLGKAAARLFRIRRTNVPTLEADLASAGLTDYQYRPFGDAFAVFARKQG